MISGIGNQGIFLAQMQAGGMRRGPSPEEMFKKVDTDGSGGIDQTEFEAMAKKMSERTENSIDVKEAFANYDANGDGQLQADEMDNLMKQMMEKDAGAANTSSQDASADYVTNPLQDALSTLLAMLNGNSGTSSNQEGDMNQMQVGSIPQGPSPEEMFKKVDTNGSGGIDQTEFEAMAKKMSERTGNSIDVKEAFANYDANGDGQLQADEMDKLMEQQRKKDGVGSFASQQALAAYGINSGQDTLSTLLKMLGSGLANDQSTYEPFSYTV